MSEKELKSESLFLKIRIFLESINPYKKPARDRVLPEKKSIVFYRMFTVWLINVIVNGAAIFFALWSILLPNPLIFKILGFGVAIWILSRILSLIWSGIVDGLREVVRNLPKR